MKYVNLGRSGLKVSRLCFHIYYSSRRQLPTGLRLLIEFIQEARPLGL